MGVELHPSAVASPIGFLPPDWLMLRLKDITTKVGSGATPRGGQEVYLPSRINYALIRSQNVFDRQFDQTGLVFISDLHAVELSGAKVQDGDILLNITGDGVTFGRACLAPQHVLPACVNQHVSIIRVDRSKCDSGYLLSYLTHPLVKVYIESFNAGGSRRAVTKGHIESFEVPLPPLPVQKAIAKTLGTLDDKIELNRRMNETLEAMARAVFQAWFVDFLPVLAKAKGGQPDGLDTATAKLFPDKFEESALGAVPEGWRVGFVNDFAELVLGGDWGSSDQTPDTSEPALCIRGADIPSLQSGGRGEMPVRYLKRSSREKRALQPGDLVIEISGGSPTQSTGRPVLITNRLLKRMAHPLVCSNFCRFLRPVRPTLATYLYLRMRWLYSCDEFLQYENGTTGIKNFAFTTFCEQHPVLIPPDTIIDQFVTIADPLFAMMQQNGLETEQLCVVSDALLPKLLSGEISPN